MAHFNWAAGIDLGGTKIQIIQVNSFGTIGEHIKCPTNVSGGSKVIEEDILNAIKELEKKVGCPPTAVGVGVAGQIDGDTGSVNFAPNLKWENVPFQKDLKRTLGIPVVVTNDVRAAAWGEWLHGAGKGSNNILCVFVGTGVGGGIVTEGRMLEGFNNTAGEIGHMTIQIDGPECTCGNRGCIEAFAGGWALAKRAKEAIKSDPHAGKTLLEKAGGKVEDIQGRHVTEASREGDALAEKIVDEAIDALGAGTASLVNAVSPQRVIFGGGVVEGSPEILKRLEKIIRERALEAASKDLEVLQAKLHNDAGAIGAGALAIRRFIK